MCTNPERGCVHHRWVRMLTRRAASTLRSANTELRAPSAASQAEKGQRGPEHEVLVAAKGTASTLLRGDGKRGPKAGQLQGPWNRPEPASWHRAAPPSLTITAIRQRRAGAEPPP